MKACRELSTAFLLLEHYHSGLGDGSGVGKKVRSHNWVNQKNVKRKKRKTIPILLNKIILLERCIFIENFLT